MTIHFWGMLRLLLSFLSYLKELIKNRKHNLVLLLLAEMYDII